MKTFTKLLLIFCTFQYGANLYAQVGWQKVESGATQNLLSVTFIDSNIVIILGDSGTILRSIDAGLSWREVGSKHNFNFRSISFPSRSFGVISNANFAGSLTDPTDSFNVYKSIDSGLSWIPIRHYFNFTVLTVSFLDSLIGIVAGTGWDGYGGKVSRTTDGGIHWSDTTFISPAKPTLPLFAIQTSLFMDSNKVLLLGSYFDSISHSIIFFSTNKGNSWNDYQFEKYFGDNDFVSILKKFNSHSCYLLSNHYISYSHYWSHEILISWDNGNSWDAHSAGLGSVFMIDSLKLVTCSDNYIRRSTDLGLNWYSQFFPDSFNFTDITFCPKDSSIGLAVGTMGIIYRTSNGGIPSSVEQTSDLPVNYQFFPDPFTESTYLQFNNLKPEFIRLSIFNMLGEIVATPFSGIMQNGEHKIEFNGKDIPQGFYFYRIEAGGEVKFGKILKIK